MAGENLLVVDDSPTILKVVESALSRAGYRVDTAADTKAGMTLARTRRPAIILVDSLIASEGGASGSGPIALVATGRSNKSAAEERPTGGVIFCGALAADPTLARTPVVLMTAKGEDLESRYAQAPNVIDYITKPFSPDALVAVVTHVIEKASAGAKTTPSAVVGSGNKAGETSRPPSAVAQALSQSVGPQQIDALARLREGMAEKMDHYRQEAGAWELKDIIKGGLADDVLAQLLTDAGFTAADGGDAAPDLAGRLGATTLSEVLSLLAQQMVTGTLRVLADSARVEVFVRKGLIDFAAALGVADEFLLGRFAVEAGDITPEALAEVLDARARVVGKPPLFGRDLVSRGLLTPEQLHSAMRRQTAELIYETLRWSRGTFQFRSSQELPELARDAALTISIDTLLLEGFRRVDEWRLIEHDIQNFDLVFVRADDRIADLPRGTLTRDEIAVLDALSGKSSVRDVVRALRMGSFDVSKILYRLLRTKLIRRRVQPVAAP